MTAKGFPKELAEAGALRVDVRVDGRAMAGRARVFGDGTGRDGATLLGDAPRHIVEDDEGVVTPDELRRLIRAH